MGLVAVTGSRGDVAVSTDILSHSNYPFIHTYVIMNAIESILSICVCQLMAACSLFLCYRVIQEYVFYVCMCM